eukprot:scaffold31509_cov71-Phaeocystis_antarctica.AAC.1
MRRNVDRRLVLMFRRPTDDRTFAQLGCRIAGAVLGIDDCGVIQKTASFGASDPLGTANHLGGPFAAETGA